MKIQFSDNGEIIEAKSFKEIVDYIRESAPMVGADSNHDYMIGYAQRSVISNNEDIRATSEEEFIFDLMKKGHIKLLET